MTDLDAAFDKVREVLNLLGREDEWDVRGQGTTVLDTIREALQRAQMENERIEGNLGISLQAERYAREAAEARVKELEKALRAFLELPTYMMPSIALEKARAVLKEEK